MSIGTCMLIHLLKNIKRKHRKIIGVFYTTVLNRSLVRRAERDARVNFMLH